MDDYDSDESSDEGGQVALALDPTQLSEENGLPQNGHDYLKLVQEERQKYPSVIADSMRHTTNQSSSNQSDSNPTMSMDTTSSGSGLQSDLSNRDEIVANFKQLRDKIANSSSSKVPESSTCSEKQLKKMNQRAEKTAARLIKLMSLALPPSVSTIIECNQMELHMTLQGLVECPNIHYDWIYSLMAALKEPIEADIYSTLRQIARRCISRGKTLEDKVFGVDKGKKSEEEAEEEYSSCLLIICIVRNYFGQLDLNIVDLSERESVQAVWPSGSPNKGWT